MTKGELKAIIRECMEEVELENEAVNFEVDADEVELENALLVESACLGAIDEGVVGDSVKNAIEAIKTTFRKDSEERASKALIERTKAFRKEHPDCPANKAIEQVRAMVKKEQEEKEAKKAASLLGKGFKAIEGKIVAMDKKDKAIAAAATAVVAAATTAGIIVAKKKLSKKEEEEA